MTVISESVTPVMVLLGETSGSPLATAILAGLLAALSEQTYISATADTLGAALNKGLEVRQLGNGTIILRLVEGE